MIQKLTKQQIIYTVIAVLLAIFSGYVMLKGSGFFPSPTLAEILFAVILIIALGSSKLSFYGLLLPIAIGYALYTPIGLSFGAPSYQYIASLFATDLLEGREFLSQLPLTNYLLAVGMLVAVIFFPKNHEKNIESTF